MYCGGRSRGAPGGRHIACGSPVNASGVGRSYGDRDEMEITGIPRRCASNEHSYSESQRWCSLVNVSTKVIAICQRGSLVPRSRPDESRGPINHHNYLSISTFTLPSITVHCALSSSVD